MGTRDRRAEIVTELEQELRALPRGHRVPGEQQLVGRFEVSRATIRAALQELEAQHLIRRVAGVGTFVQHRIAYPITPRHAPTFSEVVRAAGAKPRTVLLEHAVVGAPQKLAGTLPVQPGQPVQQLRRLGHIDQEPACLHEEWFSPRVEVDLGLAVRSFGSVGEVLRSAGFRPRRILTRGTMAAAPEAICAQLGIPLRAQAWMVASTSVDDDSQEALVHSRSWLRADLVRMVFDVVPLTEADPGTD
ncbi:GntR family transcriptional regulator [Luteococcus sp. H138]|uniref:GntR family transcriptional regulator n=1 Tax=unclassified Luteococcus TaxID=2639923 RepID=UPI00313B5FDA